MTYSVFSLVVPWTRPVRECINPARRAFDMANEQSDPTYAAYACWNLTSSLLAAGDPLEQVERCYCGGHPPAGGRQLRHSHPTLTARERREGTDLAALQRGPSGGA
jgi:hypothetical protein